MNLAPRVAYMLLEMEERIEFLWNEASDSLDKCWGVLLFLCTRIQIEDR